MIHKTKDWATQIILIYKHLLCRTNIIYFSVDRGFVLRSGQTKGYELGICCFSTKELEQRLVAWESG